MLTSIRPTQVAGLFEQGGGGGGEGGHGEGEAEEGRDGKGGGGGGGVEMRRTASTGAGGGGEPETFRLMPVVGDRALVTGAVKLKKKKRKKHVLRKMSFDHPSLLYLRGRGGERGGGGQGRGEQGGGLGGAGKDKGLSAHPAFTGGIRGGAAATGVYDEAENNL